MNELPWLHPARVASLEGALRERILVIDGAMGTTIQRHELQEADYLQRLGAADIIRHKGPTSPITAL